MTIQAHRTNAAVSTPGVAKANVEVNKCLALQNRNKKTMKS